MSLGTAVGSIPIWETGTLQGSKTGRPLKSRGLDPCPTIGCWGVGPGAPRSVDNKGTGGEGAMFSQGVAEYFIGEAAKELPGVAATELLDGDLIPECDCSPASLKIPFILYNSFKIISIVSSDVLFKKIRYNNKIFKYF